jgi:hypothetical protein
LRERHQMADDPFPFVFAGTVVSWDSAARVLYVGSTRLEVASGVAVKALVPQHSVTVSGHRVKDEVGSWVVTEIRANRREF